MVRLRLTPIVWLLCGLMIGVVFGSIARTYSISNSITITPSITYTMALTVNCSSAASFTSVSLGIVNRGQSKSYTYCLNNTGTTTFYYSTTTSFQQASTKSGSGCGPFASPQFRCPETDHTSGGPIITLVPSATLLVSILLTVSTSADPGSASWTDTSQVYQDPALTTIATSASYSVSLTVQ